MLADQLAHAVDGARRLAAPEQEQVLAVPGDPVERWAQARVAGELGCSPTLRHPGAEDLLAHVLDLDRARLLGQVCQRRLGSDQAVEQIELVMLETDVQDVGLATGRHVARHLERHRGLARALGAADQQQLARTEPGADRLVQRREAEGDRLVLPDLAAGDLLVEVHQHLDRRTRRHTAVGSVETPGWTRRCPGIRHVLISSRESAEARILTPCPDGPCDPSVRAGTAQSTYGRRRAPSSSQSRTITLVPCSKLSRRNHSLGAWALQVGWVKPTSTTGSPSWWSNAAVTGIEPPSRM